jgi:glutathione S-transferase/RNA polymerase-associated protein
MQDRRMVKLYEHPLSPYAQKCKIALMEKGVAFELLQPDSFATGRPTGEFAAANPRAEVPALVDGDVAVFDSTIILEYIEDRWPDPPLLPSTPADRARVRMIEDVVDTQYDAINWGLMEILAFKRADGELASKLLSRAAEQTANMHAWLERQLGARDWFNGDAFGWGDLSVIPYVNGSSIFGTAVAEGTKLAAWQQRANERPSVASTAAAASEFVATSAVDMGELVAQGAFKREYRDHRVEWMIRSGGIDIVLEGLREDTIRFSNEIA